MTEDSRKFRQESSIHRTAWENEWQMIDEVPAAADSVTGLCPHSYFNKSSYGEDKERVEIPSEMFEFVKVLYHSASSGKYPPNNWLQKDGIKSNKKSMVESMFRHLAAVECDLDYDPDSNLDPLLHLAARALMLYTRKKKGLEN